MTLLHLVRAQALCIHKSTEVNIVSNNEYLVFAPFLVVVPSFKDLNDSQELLIVDFVTSLSWDHLLKEKSY